MTFSTGHIYHCVQITDHFSYPIYEFRMFKNKRRTDEQFSLNLIAQIDTANDSELFLYLSQFVDERESCVT